MTRPLLRTLCASWIVCLAPIPADGEWSALAPASAAGYLEVEVAAIGALPGALLLKELVGQVRDEATALSMARLGLDVTTVSRATLLVPERAGEAPVAVLQLTTRCSEGSLSDSLQNAWRKSTVHGRSIWVDSTARWSICLLSPDHVAFAGPAGMDWYLGTEELRRGQPPQPGPPADDHLRLVVQLDRLPEAAAHQLPMLLPLLDAELFSAGVRLGPSGRLSASWQYADEDQRRQGEATLKLLVALARGHMSGESQRIKSRLDHPQTPLAEACGALASLAASRQLEQLLRELRCSSEAATLRATAELPLDATVLVGATLSCLQAAEAIHRGNAAAKAALP